MLVIAACAGDLAGPADKIELSISPGTTTQGKAFTVVIRNDSRSPITIHSAVLLRMARWEQQIENRWTDVPLGTCVCYESNGQQLAPGGSVTYNVSAPPPGTYRYWTEATFGEYRPGAGGEWFRIRSTPITVH